MGASRWAIFCNFGKKKIFKYHVGNILHVFSAIENNQIFQIWKPIEKIKLVSLPFTYRSNPKHV